MKVLFLMTLNAGTSYWRLYNPAKNMEQNGTDVTLFPQFDPAFPYVYTWEADLLVDSVKGEIFGNLMSWADIVVGQRFFTEAGLSVIDVLQQEFKKKFFMEIDDNIHYVPADHPAYEQIKPGTQSLKIAEKQLKLSDGVIVSTEYLKKVYIKYNKNIHVMPNAIDFKLWKHKSRKNKKFVNIGYVGGQQHVRDLKILNKVIPSILDKYKNVRFIIWGGAPEIIPEGPRVIKYSTFAPVLDYPRELAKLNYDIGLAPLVDNYLNRSKSCLRWLEYSALGIPTVASPIEPFNRVSPIFTCQQSDEWITTLSHLIESPEVRETVGMAAQEKVKRDYNIQGVVDKYTTLLKKEVMKNA